MDPVGTAFYPTKSPYIGMLNNPIVYADYEGRAVFYVVLGVKAGALYGGRGDLILAIDHNGNVAIIGEAGAGAAFGAYAGGGIGANFRLLGTVDDLKGPNIKLGGAAADALGGEFDLSIPLELKDGKLQFKDIGEVVFDNADEKVGDNAVEFYLRKLGGTPKVTFGGGMMLHAMMTDTRTFYSGTLETYSTG